jgi:hypothetical protein
VEIEATDEEQALEILSEVRKAVARNPEVEHAEASGVECLFDCTGHYSLEDLEDDEDLDDRPF